MPFRTVLSIVGVNQPDADLSMSIGLCRRETLHLSVLVAGISLPPPAGEFGVVFADAWAAERQERQSRVAERAETVKALLAEADISADITMEFCDRVQLDRAVGQRARCTDLTLLGPAMLADEEIAEPVLYGALFESARPVLVVPAGAVPSLAPKRILIAWNSGQEAARAVREALDMVAGADAVHIALVDPRFGPREAGPEPGADLAAYLARHGAKVTIDRLAGGGRSAAEVISAHAADTAADLIVLGAYGHSRLRERIFGGVTASMIDKPAVPLLLAR